MEEWVEKHVDELSFEEMQEMEMRSTGVMIGTFSGFGVGVGVQMVLMRKAGLENMLHAGTRGAKAIYGLTFALPLGVAFAFGSYFRERQRAYAQELMDKYTHAR